MSIKVERFVAKAPIVEAALLSTDNIDEMAAWLGADGYTLEKTLKEGYQRVVFVKHPTNSVRIVRAVVGDWIVRYPKHVDDHGGERDEYYYSLTQEELDAFVNQQREKGEIDIEHPYNR